MEFIFLIDTMISSSNGTAPTTKDVFPDWRTHLRDRSFKYNISFDTSSVVFGSNNSSDLPLNANFLDYTMV